MADELGRALAPRGGAPGARRAVALRVRGDAGREHACAGLGVSDRGVRSPDGGRGAVPSPPPLRPRPLRRRPPLPPPSRGGPPPAAGSPSPPWSRPWSSRPGRRGSPSRPATSRAPTPLRRRSRRARRWSSGCGPSWRRPCAPTGELSFELKALAPGSEPDFALDRVGNALPATRRALAGAEVPAARSALRAQVSYLKVVRDTLKLETDDGQLDRLGGASARLVDRLERVDSSVPRASDSVGGARKLKAWALAELAPAYRDRAGRLRHALPHALRHRGASRAHRPPRRRPSRRRRPPPPRPRRSRRPSASPSGPA